MPGSKKRKAPPLFEVRDRIKEFRRVPAAELAANPANWRKHPEAQRAALRGVLEEVGIAGPLIAYHSARNGGALTLIDGHLRQEDAPSTGRRSSSTSTTVMLQWAH